VPAVPATPATPQTPQTPTAGTPTTPATTPVATPPLSTPKAPTSAPEVAVDNSTRTRSTASINTTNVGLIVGLAIGACVLVVLLVVGACLARSMLKKDQQSRAVVEDGVSGDKPAPVMYDDAYAANDLTVSKLEAADDDGDDAVAKAAAVESGSTARSESNYSVPSAAAPVALAISGEADDADADGEEFVPRKMASLKIRRRSIPFSVLSPRNDPSGAADFDDVALQMSDVHLTLSPHPHTGRSDASGGSRRGSIAMPASDIAPAPRMSPNVYSSEGDE